jgi:hypothetical protein
VLRSGTIVNSIGPEENRERRGPLVEALTNVGSRAGLAMNQNRFLHSREDSDEVGCFFLFVFGRHAEIDKGDHELSAADAR